VKVTAQSSTRRDIVATANACGAKILDVAPSSIVLEITGDPDEVERFIEAVRPFGLKEMMRTGRIAMTRGSANLSALATTNRSAQSRESPLPIT
jgi:acetolactate synthase-1/3 small subunit